VDAKPKTKTILKGKNMKTTDQKIQALIDSRASAAAQIHIIISLVDVMTHQQFINAVDSLYIKVSGVRL